MVDALSSGKNTYSFISSYTDGAISTVHSKFIMLITTLLLAATAVVPAAAGVWPLPKEQSLGDKVAWINSRVKVDIQYAKAANSSSTYKLARHEGYIVKRQTSKQGIAETRINSAVERAKCQLFKDNFVPWMFHKKGVDFTPKFTRKDAIEIKSILIKQTDPEPDNSADEVIDESYTLIIKQDTDPKDAVVEITGKTSLGVLHGLTSLTQLFYSDGANRVYTPYLPVTIKDAPKFNHRGLNLDVARSFYTVDDIKHTIDVLSWHKMNRFHIHITESQSWPLEIPSMPDLAAKGAYTKSQIYSVKDVSEIYAYAQMRGIKVIMEIDTPGHTASIAYSRPELIANFNRQPWTGFCAQPPCGQLMLDSRPVDEFMTSLYGDLLPRLKSSGATYFHSGGDEYNANSAAADPTVGSNSTAVITPKLQRFVSFLHEKIMSAGLTPVVWEEMLLDWNLKLDPKVIIQAWLSTESVQKIVAKGHRVIVGNYQLWYLDCGYGLWVDIKPGEIPQFYPFKDYCDPQKNWRLIYSYDPLEGIPADKAHLVIGGEVHMWSEQVDGQVLDARVWPRASSAAEVLWSGNKEANGQNRTQVSITPRIAEMRERLVARGVRASLVTQGWCLQNPGDCQWN
ncbi:Beta-hexosaminidase [Drechslerella dactyloides]|uniref:Beta-hexosaminidase n=1 Tax=Drechslerella dactyloides TaxID=74499 RepID=A0AAD6NMT0_DREDA|nr:Beta-hexosaminidase [Drechslerella dactyloides]